MATAGCTGVANTANVISLTSGVLPANTLCEYVVNVTGTSGGLQTNEPFTMTSRYRAWLSHSWFCCLKHAW